MNFVAKIPCEKKTQQVAHAKGIGSANSSIKCNQPEGQGNVAGRAKKSNRAQDIGFPMVKNIVYHHLIHSIERKSE